MEPIESFIKRENLELFRKRLADPALSDGAREVLLKLLVKEEAKDVTTTKEHERESRRSSRRESGALLDRH